MSEQEYFVATEALFIGRARAHNAGDVVSGAHVEKYGWGEQVTPQASGSRPPGIKQILAEVGDDPAKAAAALETEVARDDARPTLVAKLEALANPGS